MPDLLDAGVIFGTGFAPFRGGPLNYARERGVDDVVGSLTAARRNATVSDLRHTVVGRTCDRRHECEKGCRETVRCFTMRALEVPEVVELKVEYVLDVIRTPTAAILRDLNRMTNGE